MQPNFRPTGVGKVQHTVTVVVPAFDGLASFLLELLVEGEGGETLAEGAGDAGDGPGGAAHHPAEHAPHTDCHALCKLAGTLHSALQYTGQWESLLVRIQIAMPSANSLGPPQHPAARNGWGLEHLDPRQNNQLRQNNQHFFQKQRKRQRSSTVNIEGFQRKRSDSSLLTFDKERIQILFNKQKSFFFTFRCDFCKQILAGPTPGRIRIREHNIKYDSPVSKTQAEGIMASLNSWKGS
jgi:hypothetical protein